jgi:hypothetical protein
VTIYEKRVHELQTLNSTLVRGRDTLEAEVRRLAHENELLREAKLRDLQRGDSEHQSEESSTLMWATCLVTLLCSLLSV